MATSKMIEKQIAVTKEKQQKLQAELENLQRQMVVYETFNSENAKNFIRIELNKFEKRKKDPESYTIDVLIKKYDKESMKINSWDELEGTIIDALRIHYKQKENNITKEIAQGSSAYLYSCSMGSGYETWDKAYLYCINAIIADEEFEKIKNKLSKISLQTKDDAILKLVSELVKTYSEKDIDYKRYSSSSKIDTWNTTLALDDLNKQILKK